MNIFPIDFLDTSTFTANLLLRHKAKFQELEPGLSVLPLRNDAGDLPVLAEWGSAKALLSRIRSTAARILPEGKPGVLARAHVVTLNPGTVVPWGVDEEEYGATVHRLHVCVIPSPGCWIYAGGESANPAVGILTLVNHQTLYSAINIGQHPCTHLIVDVLRQTAD